MLSRVAKSAKASSRIDYGKGRPELYLSIGIASNRSLAGPRICKAAANLSFPFSPPYLEMKPSGVLAFTLSG